MIFTGGAWRFKPVQRSAVQCSAVQCNVVQCGEVQCAKSSSVPGQAAANTSHR
jgi:hypothetical protein